MNFILILGDIPKNIFCKDSLENPINTKAKLTLLNPPFSVKKNYEEILFNNDNNNIKEYIPIKTSSALLLFLQATISYLDTDGYSGLISPYGQDIFGKNKDYIDCRKFLLEKCSVEEIYINPSGTFRPYTGVDTIYIKYKKGYSTTQIKYYNLKIDKTYELIKIINIEDIKNNNYSLDCNSYTSYNKSYNNILYKKIGDIVKFEKKSKRQASFGKKIGKYPFYTSSKEGNKFCDECDYTDECIIIGTGGVANIKINKNFSCSADNLIMKSNDNNILTQYIYHYLLNNLHLLEEKFHGSVIKHLIKDDLIKIEIPIPSLNEQLDLINNIKLTIVNEIKTILDNQNDKFNDLIKMFLDINDNILLSKNLINNKLTNINLINNNQLNNNVDNDTINIINNFDKKKKKIIKKKKV